MGLLAPVALEESVPATQVASKLLTTAPPLSAAAVNATAALPSPGVTELIVGASATVTVEVSSLLLLPHAASRAKIASVKYGVIENLRIMNSSASCSDSDSVALERGARVEK